VQDWYDGFGALGDCVDDGLFDRSDVCVEGFQRWCDADGGEVGCGGRVACLLQDFDEEIPVLRLVVGTVDEDEVWFCHFVIALIGSGCCDWGRGGVLGHSGGFLDGVVLAQYYGKSFLIYLAKALDPTQVAVRVVVLVWFCALLEVLLSELSCDPLTALSRRASGSCGIILSVLHAYIVCLQRGCSTTGFLKVATCDEACDTLMKRRRDVGRSKMKV
jgi:hypothetical protein